MEMEISFDFRMYIGLVGRNELANRIGNKDPASIKYYIPVLYKSPDFFSSTPSWHVLSLSSIDVVFGGGFNYSQGEIRYAPALPDPELATEEDVTKFFNEFVSFMKELSILYGKVSKQEKKAIIYFKLKNVSIWSSFLLMLPEDIRSKFESGVKSILI
ncbi:MAG: hypothetical protein ACP5T9_06235 [Thermoplasmata archaeon]